MPPLLLPMQFVQAFGMSDSLPLNTFSFFANRRRLRNLRLAARVLRVASNQHGDPYQYGAAGPGRFDCSGLVMFVFRKARRTGDVPVVAE